MKSTQFLSTICHSSRMTKALRHLLLPLFWVSMLSVLAMTEVNGQCLVDQEQLDHSRFFSDPYPFAEAQTFMVGRDGNICSLWLWLSSVGFDSVQVAIRPVIPAPCGDPSDPHDCIDTVGPPLLTAVLKAIEVPPATYGGWVEINDLCLPVTAGDTLAITLEPHHSNGPVAWHGSQTDTYPFGESYRRPTGGQDWVVFDRPPYDFAFKVWVDPQIPFSIGSVANTHDDQLEDITVDDLDGDGDLDLAVANTSVVSLFLNDGFGNFTEAAGPSILAWGEAIESADVDLDGDIDLCVTRSQGDVTVLLNDGNATFSSSTRYTTGSGSLDLAVGDLNGDCVVDMAVTNFDSHDVSVLLNDGTGQFLSAVNYPWWGATQTGPSGIAAGDFDDDGDLDLAVADYETDGIHFMLNDGSGTFTIPILAFAAGDNPYGVVAADLNFDSYLDLAVANTASDNVSVILSTGAVPGSFQPAIHYTAGDFPFRLAITDFERDGDFDLAVANNGSDFATLLRNDRGGDFDTSLELSVGTNCKAVATGDFDDDCDLDLAFSSRSPSDVVWLLFNETCQSPFSTSHTFCIVGGGNGVPFSFSIVGTAISTGTIYGSTGTVPISQPAFVLAMKRMISKSRPGICTRSITTSTQDCFEITVPGGELGLYVGPSCSDPSCVVTTAGCTFNPTIHKCECPCHADPQCDGITNVFDVVEAVDVAFRSETPTFGSTCIYSQTDASCDEVTDVFDVVAFVDVAFRSADPVTTFCDPCAP